MKILTIFGTRPQIIKSCLLSKELKKNNINEIVVHTGQHYDDNMSNIFFKGLDINKPDYHLNINGKSHSEMTGIMMIEIEQIVLKEKPDYVLVYGDCNTTLAGAIVASKMNIPLIHVESGLRSFDKKMPEEVNRVLTDHVSDILLCPTLNAVLNLNDEGISKNVFLTGDLMIELLRKHINKIKSDELHKKFNLQSKEYYLATIHRQSNTTPEKIKEILTFFASQQYPVLFCVHPRTKNVIEKNDIKIPSNIICSEPVGFLEILNLLHHSRALFTDSGGLQKEAYELETPCFTIRETTEWKELLESGWNKLGFPKNTEDNIREILKLDRGELYMRNTSKHIVSSILKLHV